MSSSTVDGGHLGDLPRRIFAPIAVGYDGPAQLLSLYQYRRWHRFLISRLNLWERIHSDGRSLARVLDMATGTGALAFDLIKQPNVEVIAADITRPMLLQARARASHDGAVPHLVECTAEAPPFADNSFDAIVSAYLLRYVADVPATLAALARLLTPGGTLAFLDFAVPWGPFYPLWRLYTALGLPLAGALFSPAWRRVGSFLGVSIRDFYHKWPEERLLQAWRNSGFPDVQARRLSLGGALVMWGTKVP